MADGQMMLDTLVDGATGDSPPLVVVSYLLALDGLKMLGYLFFVLDNGGGERSPIY